MAYNGEERKTAQYRGGETVKLANQELQSIYFGAYRFSETADGYLMAHQYTEAQEEYFKHALDFWYERCNASTAKTLEFVTEATRISFDYQLLWVGSEDSFELCVDGLITDIRYIKNMDRKGTLSFDMPEGEKSVILYLPADALAVIRNFEINAAFRPAVKGEKVLWLGDSITQGYGPLRSAQTYVSVANRLLNYDIINQGIGGYIYDPKVLVEMPGYRPDKIIVALGTNQYGTESMADIEEYYRVITELYKGVPILAITPLWRGDNPEGVPTLMRFCERLKEIIRQYEIVTMVDGWRMVPHLPEYFIDNLHPNPLGTEVYAGNLVRAIRETGF